MAGYADAAAEQLDTVTRSFRNRSVGELLDEAERLARRDPALFIGGAFILGVFGARFLKASAPDRFGPGAGKGAAPDGQRAFGYAGYAASRTEVNSSDEYSGYRGYSETPAPRAYAADAEMAHPSNPAHTPAS